MVELAFNGKDIIPAVNTVGIVVTSRINPSLQYVSIDIEDNTAVLSATNLEQFLSVSVPVQVSKDNDVPVSTMYFDYSILKDVVGGMNKNSNIIFRIDTDQLKCSVIQEKAHYKLNLIDPTNVSIVKQPVLSNAVIVKLSEDHPNPVDINKVLFTVSNSAESRREFQGILFVIKKDTFKLVATDGTVLAVYTNPVNSSKPVQAIVPGKAVNILQKIADTKKPLTIQVSKSVVKFALENIILSTLCINGTFPPYEMVLDAENKCSITVDKDVLLLALSRLSKISKRGNGKVSVKLEAQTLKIKAVAPGQIEGIEEVPIEKSTCSAPLTIILHADRFHNTVQNCTGKVKFGIKGNLSPVHITGDEANYHVVIMPQKGFDRI